MEIFKQRLSPVMISSSRGEIISIGPISGRQEVVVGLGVKVGVGVVVVVGDGWLAEVRSFSSGVVWVMTT